MMSSKSCSLSSGRHLAVFTQDAHEPVWLLTLISYCLLLQCDAWSHKPACGRPSLSCAAVIPPLAHVLMLLFSMPLLKLPSLWLVPPFHQHETTINYSFPDVGAPLRSKPFREWSSLRVSPWPSSPSHLNILLKKLSQIPMSTNCHQFSSRLTP